VFDRVKNILFESDFYHSRLIIDTIKGENPKRQENIDANSKDEYKYSIDLFDGFLSFKSIGFKQFIRASPIEVNIDNLGLEKRGGISFSKFTI